MYTFICSDSILSRLTEFSEVSTSIPSRLEELASNPYSRAKEIEIPNIGGYYVNAGRVCIVFDIDEQQKSITILKVVLSPYLYKLITGKIEPE